MKPLKILLGNNTLSLLAGSETWTQTLAEQLKEMGHDVSCFSPELGVVADELLKKGIKSFSSIQTSEIKPFSYVLEEAVDHNYDVVISNHYEITNYLRRQLPKTPIISTIHGIIHEFEGQIAPEHPALDAGVNQFVAVSEEVQALLKEKYNIDSVIIRNFFDLKKLGSLKTASPGKPKQFLINTNYMSADDPAIKVIREVAKYFDAKVGALGVNFSQMLDVSKAIEDSDVVFGMGRSVLEGVAAGRLGICHGRWGTGGPIVEKHVDEIRRFNFSGRNSQGVFFTKEELISLIEDYYKDEHLEWSKNYIAKEHNVVWAAEEYIRITRELLSPMVSSLGVSSEARPFRLAK